MYCLTVSFDAMCVPQPLLDAAFNAMTAADEDDDLLLQLLHEVYKAGSELYRQPSYARVHGVHAKLYAQLNPQEIIPFIEWSGAISRQDLIDVVQICQSTAPPRYESVQSCCIRSLV